MKNSKQMKNSGFNADKFLLISSSRIPSPVFLLLELIVSVKKKKEIKREKPSKNEVIT